MDESNEILNKINRKKEGDKPLFDENLLGNVHTKVVDKLLGKERFTQQDTKKETKMQSKADVIIACDKNVRESVQSLIMALSDLGDRDIAMKLIGQHILFLNDMFKEFEKE